MVDVTLPDDSVEPVTDPNSLNFLTVTVNPDGELNVNGTPTPKAKLLEQIPAYLDNNPDSIVLLVPDPKMPYEQTIQLLAQMRDTGGDRVSLAIGGGSEAE